MISACGLLCGECEFYEKSCEGCDNIKGVVFWMNGDICPFYKCAVVEHELKNCGDCSEIPCDMFYKIKDPNITEEKHLESINKRVSRLKNR